MIIEIKKGKTWWDLDLDGAKYYHLRRGQIIQLLKQRMKEITNNAKAEGMVKK